MQKNNQSYTSHLTFPKSTTGIQGLDVITNGGLPKNRPILWLGNPGCGKTIMATQFLVNGVVIFDEPGVFISFEEKTDELITNVNPLGYDLNKHIADNKMYLEYIKISQEEIQQTGRYELEVIEIYHQPSLALTEEITAIPLLTKKLPLPEERLIGDMSDIEKVLKGLHPII